MKKKILIGGVVVLIAILIAIGIGLVRDLKVEASLKKEIKQLMYLTNEENIQTEKINEMLTRRTTEGEYLPVEEAAKEYITDAFKNITKIHEILEDEKIENILTIENYKTDGPKFLVTKEYISNTKQELQNLKTSYEELFTEEKMMTYINNKNLDDYYVDLYKNELLGNPEKSKSEAIVIEINDILTTLDNCETIIDFLINNSANWKIENENILFSTQDLSTEFLDLINNMLQNIPGTNIEKDFGTYEIPIDWIESTKHSTRNKFFYIKKGQENETRPNNISVNKGTNKYAINEHEKFRIAILNQLSMQLGKDDSVQLTANGSTTKNGYILYTFTIKEEGCTTTQYYIVGDYEYILIHETTYGESVDTDNAAKKIINTFKWN